MPNPDKKELLDTTRWTLWSMCKSGKIGHVRVSTKKIVFSQKHVEDFLRSRERKPS